MLVVVGEAVVERDRHGARRQGLAVRQGGGEDLERDDAEAVPREVAHLLPEGLRALSIPPEIQWVIYGGLMILVVYFLPAGIVPALRSWWQGRGEKRTEPPAKAAPAATGASA